MPAIAMAEALVLDTEDYRIPTRYVEDDQIGHELELLPRAIEAAIKELKEQRDNLKTNYGKDIAAIFDFHAAILQDPKLRREIENLINAKSCSAAYAVSRTFLTMQRRFSNLRDPVFAQRIKDIQDIEKRLLRHLLGEEREDLDHLTKDVILSAPRGVRRWTTSRGIQLFAKQKSTGEWEYPGRSFDLLYMLAWRSLLGEERDFDGQIVFFTSASDLLAM